MDNRPAPAVQKKNKKQQQQQTNKTKTTTTKKLKIYEALLGGGGGGGGGMHVPRINLVMSQFRKVLTSLSNFVHRHARNKKNFLCIYERLAARKF